MFRVHRCPPTATGKGLIGVLRGDLKHLSSLLRFARRRLKPGLWAFLCQKTPKPTSDPGSGPGSNGPGLGRLWALGPAQHITNSEEAVKIGLVICTNADDLISGSGADEEDGSSPKSSNCLSN